MSVSGVVLVVSERGRPMGGNDVWVWDWMGQMGDGGEEKCNVRGHP